MSEDRAGEATLPLTEILRLYALEQTSRAEATPTPPLRAALQRVQLEGTLLEDALEVRATLEAVVLADDDAWTRLELLDVSKTTHLSGLPGVSGGMLVLDEGKLVFLTRKPGRYPIELSFLEQAVSEDAIRRARIALPSNAPAELRLRFSPELFALEQEAARQDARGALVLPRDGAFEVTWRALEAARPVGLAETGPAEPPAATEPVIAHARAASVATLEGQRITRLAYDLRSPGRRALALELPEGEEVQHVYLNGRSAPFTLDGRMLTIQVKPGRPGGDRAQLELLLTCSIPSFLLSGSVHVELPAPAWPTSQLSLSLYLPEVFEYEWSGGSLSPVDDVVEASYQHDIPQPGRRLTFHQYLVRQAAPDVALRYTVDLRGQYFER